jgi:hypothetical protein
MNPTHLKRGQPVDVLQEGNYAGQGLRYSKAVKCEFVSAEKNGEWVRVKLEPESGTPSVKRILAKYVVPKEAS